MDRGIGYAYETDTITLSFINYEEVEYVRIYVDGDLKKVPAYKSINISIL